MKKIRIVIADDSPMVTRVLRDVLSSDDDLEVVALAKDGLEALHMVQKHKPDLLCTDFYMPHMNGLELTRKLMQEFPLPIIVITVSALEDACSSMDLLDAGALDIVAKPKAGFALGSVEALGLIEKVKMLAGVKVLRRHATSNGEFSKKSGASELIVAIGGSTGAPRIFNQIFSDLPPEFSLPVVCVQHIGDGFLEAFVRWLGRNSMLAVSIAENNHRPEGGHVYFPRERHHLIVDSRGLMQNISKPAESLHRPSVDQLFLSLAESFGPRVLAVLLTGMGEDGARGLLELRRRGASTIAQDAESCVVYGMPKYAVTLGAAEKVLSPQKILQAITNFGTSAKMRM